MARKRRDEAPRNDAPRPGQKHRGNTENLRPPWKPGQSGNPGGRPKGQSLTKILRDILDSEADDSGKLVAEHFVESVVTHAIERGDSALVKEIFNRIDGKVPEKIEVATRKDIEVDIGGRDDDPGPGSGGDGSSA